MPYQLTRRRRRSSCDACPCVFLRLPPLRPARHGQLAGASVLSILIPVRLCPRLSNQKRHRGRAPRLGVDDSSSAEAALWDSLEGTCRAAAASLSSLCLAFLSSTTWNNYCPDVPALGATPLPPREPSLELVCLTFHLSYPIVLYLRLCRMFHGVSVARVQLDYNGRQLRPSSGAIVTLEPKARSPRYQSPWPARQCLSRTWTTSRIEAE